MRSLASATDSPAELTARDCSAVHRQLVLAIESDDLDFSGPGPATLERLADLHPHPLVGWRHPATGQFASYRVPADQSGRYAYVELGRTGSSATAVILDIDQHYASRGAARDAIRDRGLPDASWIVRSLQSGHVHAVWTLLRPVHRYPGALRAPIDLAGRVESYFAEVMGADRGYTGVLTRQPEPLLDLEGTETLWGPVGAHYLRGLAHPIPKGWRRSLKLPLDTTPIERGTRLFRSVMVISGSRANAHRPLEPIVRQEAERCGAKTISEGDIRAIAGVVEGYRAAWAANGWHTPAWIARQAALARRGGLRGAQIRREAKAARDARIVELSAAGWSLRRIGRDVGLSSPSSVRYVLLREGAR